MVTDILKLIQDIHNEFLSKINILNRYEKDAEYEIRELQLFLYDEFVKLLDVALRCEIYTGVSQIIDGNDISYNMDVKYSFNDTEYSNVQISKYTINPYDTMGALDNLYNIFHREITTTKEEENEYNEEIILKYKIISDLTSYLSEKQGTDANINTTTMLNIADYIVENFKLKE